MPCRSLCPSTRGPRLGQGRQLASLDTCPHRHFLGRKVVMVLQASRDQSRPRRAQPPAGVLACVLLPAVLERGDPASAKVADGFAFSLGPGSPQPQAEGQGFRHSPGRTQQCQPCGGQARQVGVQDLRGLGCPGRVKPSPAPGQALLWPPSVMCEVGKERDRGDPLQTNSWGHCECGQICPRVPEPRKGK